MADGTARRFLAISLAAAFVRTVRGRCQDGSCAGRPDARTSGTVNDMKTEEPNRHRLSVSSCKLSLSSIRQQESLYSCPSTLQSQSVRIDDQDRQAYSARPLAPLPGCTDRKSPACCRSLRWGHKIRRISRDEVRGDGLSAEPL